MKRYWKLSTLTLFIVVVLGGFFFQSSFAYSSDPEFTLKQQSGDETLGNKLQVEGSYADNIEEDESAYGSEQTLTIDQEGSTYLQPSYFDQIQNMFISSEVQRLQKEHKNFMRGKNDTEQKFYEDKESLVYASVDTKTEFTGFSITDVYFDVDVLDKESGDRQTFQLDVPDKENIDFWEVNGVMLQDDELKLIANESFFDDESVNSESEYHLYSIDIAEQEIVDDALMMTNEQNPSETDDMHTDVELVGWDAQEDLEYIIFKVSDKKTELRDDMHYEDITINNEYVAYHIESGEQETVDLPKEVADDDAFLSIQLEGEHLRLDKIADGELTFYNYHLSNQKIDEQHQYDLPEGGAEDVYYTVQDGKVIIANHHQEKAISPSIIVYDYDSKEKIYEGIIDVLDNEPTTDYQLNIYDVSLK